MTLESRDVNAKFEIRNSNNAPEAHATTRAEFSHFAFRIRFSPTSESACSMTRITKGGTTAAAL
jgi:hypothetical protein